MLLDLSPLTPAFASSALVSAELAIPDMAAVQGDPQPLTYVPNRNMIFLAIAAALAESRGAGEVYYGAQRHVQRACRPFCLRAGAVVVLR